MIGKVIAGEAEASKRCISGMAKSSKQYILNLLVHEEITMEEGTKSMQIHTRQLDLSWLMHRIQSLLPHEEAIHTCVLSKSWPHALSTIPTLRFTKCGINKIQEIRYMESIDHTLLRYPNGNLPMERIDLHINTKHPRVLHPVVK
nr:hypothetical protein [Tanacetum cinerariifolium]